MVPRDQQVLMWSLFLTALLLHLAPCLEFPIRKYQRLAFLVFREGVLKVMLRLHLTEQARDSEL